MDKKEFKYLRSRLNKTQNELALLLGTSLKAVRSYEQGWRNVPTHAERQLYLLLSMKANAGKKERPCWVIKKCPSKRKKMCPAWEFRAGDLCWFINGTICEAVVHKNWKEKMIVCRSCDVWNSLIGNNRESGGSSNSDI
ncbi:helix-turn-helix domain-containing protein [Thermodesulfobacteriota bacterium]